MRAIRLLILFATLISAFCAKADVVLRDPIAVSTDLDAWTDDILAKTDAYGHNGVTEPVSGYTECALTKEVKNTYLCASYRQSTMNEIFVRATYFVEQHSTILPLNDPDYAKLSAQMGGHDLHASDLHLFYQDLLNACEKSDHEPSLCPTASEQEVFEKFILPTYAEGSDFVVIAFGILSETDAETVVSHEIMHAQYFNDDHYHQIADDFWAHQVSVSDRAKVRKILAPDYDPTNEELMRNEFQAYILMANANRNMLSSLVPKYRGLFLKTMKEGDVVPIQVE